MKPADTEIDPTRSHFDHGAGQKAEPCQSAKPVQDNGNELDAPEGFELIEEIGRGGMGIIHRARDLAFDREVALKLLQPRYKCDSPQAIRFMDEARITGQLQHPGIPAVHRTGQLPDGRPYLVMKLIRGYTLSDLIWKKSPEARDAGISPHVVPENYLSIFESICQAIGYAHAHQVIHRDLKPQNIMVGAFGEVQVMDWGLAKVMNQGQAASQETEPGNSATIIYDSNPIHSTHGTELTAAGSILGTPAYMSPEQAMGANADLDARSDVFGLGAILCCMLTGQPPFGGDHPESTRLLSAMGMLGDAYDRLDECGAEPELITLAKQCLAVKPEDRPAHGEAVARAVARFRAAAVERVRIADLERTRATLHAQELKRRRYLLLWSGAIIIGVLLFGIYGTTRGLIQAFAKEEEALISAEKERQAKITETEQLRRAEAKELETMAVLEFVDENVVSVVTRFGKGAGLDRNVMLRQVLDEALGKITSKFARQPLIEASICMTMGKSFEYLGELKTAMNLQERALALRMQHLGKQHQDTILSMLALANLQAHAEKHEDALQGRENGYALSKEHFGLESHITQMAMNNLASSFERFKRNEEALALREKVLQLTKQHRGMKDSFTLLSMNNLAMAYLYSNRQTEAYKLLMEAIELQKLHLGDDHNITLNTISSLGTCLEEMQKPEEALVLYQSILKTRHDKLGPDHPDTLSSVTELTLCLTKLGRFTDALKHAQSAFKDFEKRFGPDHEETLLCMTIIAGRLIDLKRGEEAMPEIDKFFQRVGDQNKYPQLLSTMFGLRFRHLLSISDHTQCRAILDQWENRNLTQVVSHVELAKAWSLLASLKKPAATSDADRAMEHLHKAVAEKWNDAKQLETHADFASLRTRDDYRALLNKLKKPVP